jgi:hypothetical protein
MEADRGEVRMLLNLRDVGVLGGGFYGMINGQGAYAQI